MDSKRFTKKELAEAAGIAPHKVVDWRRRHGILRASITDASAANRGRGGLKVESIYSEADVNTAQLIVAIRAAGIRLSEIQRKAEAGKWFDEIAPLVAPEPMQLDFENFGPRHCETTAWVLYFNRAGTILPVKIFAFREIEGRNANASVIRSMIHFTARVEIVGMEPRKLSWPDFGMDEPQERTATPHEETKNPPLGRAEKTKDRDAETSTVLETNPGSATNPAPYKANGSTPCDVMSLRHVAKVGKASKPPRKRKGVLLREKHPPNHART